MRHEYQPPGSNPSPSGLAKQMAGIGSSARSAATPVAQASSEVKNMALRQAATTIEASQDAILSANQSDLDAGSHGRLTEAQLDRLAVDQSRLHQIADSLRRIADLPDPVGEVIADWTRPNDLRIQRVRTPLGVVGVIYESRPNVTADAGALGLKSGNAVILRCGSDSLQSCQAIHACLQQGLLDAGLPAEAIQLVPTTDRDAVGMILEGLGGQLDVLIPRGGKSLVQRVSAESRVPVLAHLEGLCHVYVADQADFDMARQVVINSKMRRPGICGAAETLLIDRRWPVSFARDLLSALRDSGCELRGDKDVCQLDPVCQPADEQDWSTEYLAPILSVALVDDLAAAVAHIRHYGSQHTESIITDDQQQAESFLGQVDSAIVLHNASTQFADGGEFGMGAEIGIATGRLHARGPVGLEQLTTFNYRVRGSGQTRP